MNVCIFCSAKDVADKYAKPAQAFVKLLADNGHTLIWGGSDCGLMNVIASAMQKNGGKIIGVSHELLRVKVRKSADEMIIEKDLSRRKATMLKRSDAFVLLTGGIGSLDEITEILELKKHHMHNKPVAILNTSGFYSGLEMQLKRMEAEGFLTGKLNNLVYFAQTPKEAMLYIEKHAH